MVSPHGVLIKKIVPLLWLAVGCRYPAGDGGRKGGCCLFKLKG